MKCSGRTRQGHVMRNFPYFPENVFISVSLCYSRLRNRISQHLCVSQCLHGKGEPCEVQLGLLEVWLASVVNLLEL